MASAAARWARLLPKAAINLGLAKPYNEPLGLSAAASQNTETRINDHNTWSLVNNWRDTLQNELWQLLGLSIARIDTPISINLLQDSGYRQSTARYFYSAL